MLIVIGRYRMRELMEQGLGEVNGNAHREVLEIYTKAYHGTKHELREMIEVRSARATADAEHSPFDVPKAIRSVLLAKFLSIILHWDGKE